MPGSLQCALEAVVALPLAGHGEQKLTVSVIHGDRHVLRLGVFRLDHEMAVVGVRQQSVTGGLCPGIGDWRLL